MTIKLHWWGCSLAVYMERPPLLIYGILSAFNCSYRETCKGGQLYFSLMMKKDALAQNSK